MPCHVVRIHCKQGQKRAPKQMIDVRSEPLRYSGPAELDTAKLWLVTFVSGSKKRCPFCHGQQSKFPLVLETRLFQVAFLTR